MGKITILSLSVSTAVLLATFGQGMGVLRGGDVTTHLNWAMATLVIVLSANLMAIVHAAQSDRLIRSLRGEAARATAGEPQVRGLETERRL
jgi:hypothetical protein